MSEKQKRENPSFLFFLRLKLDITFQLLLLFNTLNKSLPRRSSKALQGQLLCCYCVCLCSYLYSQLRCVRTFRKCSRVFAVQIVADATPWAICTIVQSVVLLANYRILMSKQFFTDLCDTDAWKAKPRHPHHSICFWVLWQIVSWLKNPSGSTDVGLIDHLQFIIPFFQK